jgi:glycosyltransferase involved in cell wall biosynthesis
VFERQIVRALLAVEPRHEYHLFCLDKKAQTVIDIADDRVVYHQMRPAARAVAMSTSLPLAISRIRPDIFYAPVIPPPFCPKNTIMSMPCSSLVRHPEFYPPLVRLRLRFLLHRAIWKAAKIICPSDHVRDEMLERFRLPPDRLVVIHPGVSNEFHATNLDERRMHLKEKCGIDYPYFLFSGRWERRKNLTRMLEAFALFKKTAHTEHRFVVSGGRSWDSAESQAVIHRLELEDHIVDLGKTDLDELPYLYGGADAVLYASLWEGFGMPIVEAMASGTPVITSNLSAMPETAGGAALLVDPHSVEDIAEAMRRIAADAALRLQLGELGLERAKLFSWERTARETADLFAQLAG